MESNWDNSGNPTEDISRATASIMSNIGIQPIPSVAVPEKYVDVMQNIAGDCARVFGIPSEILAGDSNYSSARIDDSVNRKFRKPHN